MLDAYDYFLPPDRIAQTAIEPRDAARLLVIHRATGQLEHRVFRDLPDYLRPGDALALNQTRVIPARLRARKIPTGGVVEILLLRKIGDRRWLTMVGGHRVRVGTRLAVQARNARESPPIEAQVIEARQESQRIVEFSAPIEPYFDALGETPLPPYIHAPIPDPERYQTVYARTPGSVAAPTAGLHFTPELLLRIREMGVQIVYNTLHVGPGTFQPPREEQVRARKLHAEYAELNAQDARTINETKLRGGRIVAVGTTTVRTLETAARRAMETPAGEAVDCEGESCPWRPVSAFAGETDLFIMPGFRFRVVDAMVTNFHLPKSSLLMLVSAFAGRELILRAYDEAIREGYRFYSLGDATLIVD